MKSLEKMKIKSKVSDTINRILSGCNWVGWVNFPSKPTRNVQVVLIEPDPNLGRVEIGG